MKVKDIININNLKTVNITRRVKKYAGLPDSPVYDEVITFRAPVDDIEERHLNREVYGVELTPAGYIEILVH